ncbi:MAG: sigma factor [Ilumatobacteraceae bacterium]
MTSTSGRSSTSADDRAHPLDEQLASLHRQEGRLLSVLVTRTRRLDLAEDALAEAFARAASRWPDDGVPRNPAAWLFVTAHRLVIGRLRHEAVAGPWYPCSRSGRPPLAPPTTGSTPTTLRTGGESIGGEDERLPMLFLCCHPALSADARSALALRLVIGTPTDEIARLFLVPTPTMAARTHSGEAEDRRHRHPARTARARPARRTTRRGVPHDPAGLHRRLHAGRGTGPPPHRRRQRRGRARWRAAPVRARRRTHPRAARAGDAAARPARCSGARRATRHPGRPGPHPLATRRDPARLELVATLPPSTGYAEEVRLQALLAAEHARASTAEATDWARIVAVYTELESLTGSPVVRMNRAVAVAEASGPAAGLALLDGLDDALGDGHRLHAVRSSWPHAQGDVPTAVQAVRAAIERCANEVERRHLAERLATWTST